MAHNRKFFFQKGHPGYKKKFGQVPSKLEFVQLLKFFARRWGMTITVNGKRTRNSRALWHFYQDLKRLEYAFIFTVGRISLQEAMKGKVRKGKKGILVRTIPTPPIRRLLTEYYDPTVKGCPVEEVFGRSVALYERLNSDYLKRYARKSQLVQDAN